MCIYNISYRPNYYSCILNSRYQIKITCIQAYTHISRIYYHVPDISYTYLLYIIYTCLTTSLPLLLPPHRRSPALPNEWSVEHRNPPSTPPHRSQHPHHYSWRR